jgi:hypothetical protein
MKPSMLCLIAALAALSGCTPAAAGPLNDALAPLFTLDQSEVLHRLKALNPASLNAKDARTRLCVLERFGDTQAAERPEAGLPVEVSRIVSIFRRYWSDALLHRETLAQANSTLLEALRTELDLPGADLETAYGALQNRIESAGLHVLGGRTPPLFELMIWRTQIDTKERLSLPEGVLEAPVSLLDDFASGGWSSWASCDQTGTGGWTTSSRIMTVRSAWQLDSEAYRVSLLGHEAQHFSDKQRFPKLESSDLEFRAKLVELILADKSQADLLAKFTLRASRQRGLPHPFANFWVLEKLRERLHTQDLAQTAPEQIRGAALAELHAHTAALLRSGAAQAGTALPD